jgi:hypothetical protein
MGIAGLEEKRILFAFAAFKSHLDRQRLNSILLRQAAPEVVHNDDCCISRQGTQKRMLDEC